MKPPLLDYKRKCGRGARTLWLLRPTQPLYGYAMNQFQSSTAVCVLALVSVATAGIVGSSSSSLGGHSLGGHSLGGHEEASIGHGHHEVHHEEPKPYKFGYGVKDAHQGLDFNQQESSDGNIVSGHYRVQLPDGRTQVVTYTADWKNGYNANVQYEGEASHPKVTASHGWAGAGLGAEHGGGAEYSVGAGGSSYSTGGGDHSGGSVKWVPSHP